MTKENKKQQKKIYNRRKPVLFFFDIQSILKIAFYVFKNPLFMRTFGAFM